MRFLTGYIACSILFVLTFANPSFSQKADNLQAPGQSDSARIDELNKLGYNNRLIDPDQSYSYANKALKMAEQIHYTNGIAEAYRIKGIAKYYQNQSDSAIKNYLISLNYYEQIKNLNGIAKVTNNIGNMYREVDYDKSLEYFNKSLGIAKQLQNKELIAGIYLNIAIVYQKKKNYTLALRYNEESYKVFKAIGNPVGITQCLQSLGVVYRYQNKLDKSEEYALAALKIAKENDLNFNIASINLTLSMIYTTVKRFDEAERSIREGINFSSIIKDEKLLYDFKYNSYLLETRRQNYQKALEYLTDIYKTDSLTYKNFVSTRISLLQEQFNAIETQRKNELTIAKQRTNNILLWSSILVSALLVIVIALLFRDVRKKASNNKQLTALNAEISLQKENLDKINHNLEDIIDERTKDLKIKNKKLSDYSSHLSHQIRGPVATLKGLMNLEKEGLIEDDEFVQQIEKCVNDIDDKILNINEMLHDPQKYGFRNDYN